MSEPPVLSRALGLGGASAISTGLAFAAINFLGIAQLLTYISGPLSWIAILGAAVLMLGVRALFSELNGMHPSAAGIRLWMARAMNDRLALIITLTYMTAIVLVIAADAYIIGEAMAYAFHSGPLVTIGYVALLLAVATWLNLRGIKLAGAAEKIVTTVVVLVTVGVGVIAIASPGHVSHPGAGTHSSPLQALVLGIFVYTGFEWVTTNAEEVTKPKAVPRAMLVSVLVLAASQAVFAVAMGATLDNASLGSAYPQLLAAQQAMGHAGMLVMLAVTALTAVNTFNGGFVTLSRFIYAVAREGKLPRPLTRLNDRAVPALPVCLLGGSSLVLAVVVALTGSFTVMVSVCAALEMMIYAVAGFVVWRLRRSEPDTDRPFRVRGGAPLALVFTVLFGLLGLLASVSVGERILPIPLAVVLGCAALVTVYVFTVVPRLERREAEELAARRAARAVARAQRNTSSASEGAAS
ncbi:APC family permease [Streptomyces sp. NBC_00377]|uniref:APC family permease n=1 Tax=unclassified Streptomyces TaxID=2593676 RepID=UPI002E1639D0|nr:MULTISPECIES: APC family permease [unclassified Streptomyces]WSN46019.1 APC family permease [Streptomyces sp. NBC_01334]